MSPRLSLHHSHCVCARVVSATLPSLSGTVVVRHHAIAGMLSSSHSDRYPLFAQVCVGRLSSSFHQTLGIYPDNNYYPILTYKDIRQRSHFDPIFFKLCAISKSMIVHLEKASAVDLFRMATESKLNNVILEFYHERKSPYDHESVTEAIFPAFLELMYDTKTAATFMQVYQNYAKSPLYFHEFDNNPFPNPWPNLTVDDRVKMFECADPFILGQLVDAYQYQHQLRLCLQGSRDSYEYNMLTFAFYYRECFNPPIVSAEFANDMEDLLSLHPQSDSFNAVKSSLHCGLVDVWSDSFDRLVYALQDHLIDTFVDHITVGTAFRPITNEERETKKCEALSKRMQLFLEQYFTK